MDSDEKEQILEPEDDRIVIPVIDEEVVAGTRAVKTGGVRVNKHVETRLKKIEVNLQQEEVEVRRVPVNREIDRVPPVRRKGDTVIVPVVEEELVVTKRLVLKEEIHLIKRRTRGRIAREVEVDREHAEVQRLDAEGRVIDAPRRAVSETRPLRRRSVLE